MMLSKSPACLLSRGGRVEGRDLDADGASVNVGERSIGNPRSYGGTGPELPLDARFKRTETIQGLVEFGQIVQVQVAGRAETARARFRSAGCERGERSAGFGRPQDGARVTLRLRLVDDRAKGREGQSSLGVGRVGEVHLRAFSGLREAQDGARVTLGAGLADDDADAGEGQSSLWDGRASEGHRGAFSGLREAQDGAEAP